jgi:hypothetical protein
MNIGEYFPEQYIILRGTIFTNIHAITLLLYSNKYFIQPKAYFILILCILLYLSGIFEGLLSICNAELYKRLSIFIRKAAALL